MTIKPKTGSQRTAGARKKSTERVLGIKQGTRQDKVLAQEFDLNAELSRRMLLRVCLGPSIEDGAVQEAGPQVGSGIRGTSPEVARSGDGGVLGAISPLLARWPVMETKTL